MSFRIYENQRNKFEITKDNPEKINNADNEFKNKLKKVNKNSIKNYKYQLLTFYFAILVYIVWHIFKMCLNTIE